MAHHSRLCTVLVDCSRERFPAAVDFWSGALGRSAAPPDQPDSRYRSLVTPEGEPIEVILQRCDHRADVGLHLDLETDDVAAEVARLERLGARRKRQVKTWWVMEDPDGHAFCVVPVQSKTWPRGAVAWTD